MAVRYVDGINGNDSNDGTSRATACATLNGVISKLTWNGFDIVYIRPGIYVQSALLMNNEFSQHTTFDVDRYYPGKVILDFNKSLTVAIADAYIGCYYDTRWINIHFTGMAAGKYALYYNPTSLILPRVKNCVFYNQGTQEGLGIRAPAAADMFIKGCSFYNLSNGITGWTSTRTEDCYFNTVTTPIPTNSTNSNYNAYPGNIEANGINTSTPGNDPGFTDAPNNDFTIDSVTDNAAYLQLVRGGSNGGRIGATGKPAYLYDGDFPMNKFFNPQITYASGNLNPEWVNEGPSGTNEYTTGTPGDIIEVGNYLQIDLATTPAATGGRIRTPVLNLGALGGPQFVTATLAAYENLSAGPGFGIDNDTTLPQTIEYRSSNTVFADTDLSPAWIQFQKGAVIGVDHDYAQMRIEFRTDHTGV